MKIACRWCDWSTDVEAPVWRLQKSYGPIMCPTCHGSEVSAVPHKPHRSDNQKRSRLQEKYAAKRYGARRQKASGALPGVKGDLRDPGRLRGECKFTRAASYTLKLEELRKLEQEAGAGEVPMFEIEFQTNPPFKRFVVLPQWAYDQLYAAWRTANG